jgi:hypothetical protein
VGAAGAGELVYTRLAATPWEHTIRSTVAQISQSHHLRYHHATQHRDYPQN